MSASGERRVLGLHREGQHEPQPVFFLGLEVYYALEIELVLEHEPIEHVLIAPGVKRSVWYVATLSCLLHSCLGEGLRLNAQSHKEIQNTDLGVCK